MRKLDFCICETKAQISFAVTAKLISAFVFATWIVQSLYFLNPKFLASSNLLWVYSLVCVRPFRKPRRPVFSQRGSNIIKYTPYLFFWVKVKVIECNTTNMVNGNDSDVQGDDLSGRGSEFSKGLKSQTSKDSIMKHSKSEAVLGFRHSKARTGSFESEAKLNSRRLSENESQFKNNRFNPFDRDLHIEEDYFNDGNSGVKPKSPFGRLKSGRSMEKTFSVV